MYFGGTGRGFGIRRLSTSSSLDHIIPSLTHGGDQIAVAGDTGHIANGRLFTGIIDLGLDHPFHLVEAALDRVGTVGAGHAQQGDLGIFGRDRIARLFDARDHIGQHILRLRDRRVIVDRQLFAGKVHRGIAHGRHFFRITFHRRHTVGTGHANHGHGELFHFSHD